MIGKTKDVSVEVEAPGGPKAYRIRQVDWLEDSTKEAIQSESELQK